MISTRKERHGTAEVADPDLDGAGVEVESAFFVDLGWGVRWGKDLDADLGRAFEQHKPSEVLCPARSEPGDIDGSDAACGGDRALRNGFVPGEKLDADDTRQIHFKSFSGCLRFRTITRKRPVGK